MFKPVKVSKGNATPALKITKLPALSKLKEKGAKWPSPFGGQARRLDPFSPEERDFAKSMADRMGHTLASVAANPEAKYPEGSLGALFRRSFLTFSPEKRAVMHDNARALFTQDKTIRDRCFGVLADEKTDAAYIHSRELLDQEMKDKLGKVARRHVATQLAAVKAMPAAKKNPKDATKGYLDQIKTWVEVGFLTDDIHGNGHPDITIHSPQVLDFHWWTEEEHAEQGYWKLYKPAAGEKEMEVLATGVNGSNEGGIFSIDFSNYLPAEPADDTSVYMVRVLPQKKMSLGISDEVLNGKIIGVGPWSIAAIIYYAKADAPPQTFTMQKVFRKMEFCLDSITMIDDQSGPGAEEFYVSGVVQEIIPGSVAAQHLLETVFAELDPDGTKHEDFLDTYAFHLNNPTPVDWPRSYLAFLSVLEVDDGDALSSWQSEIQKIADTIIHLPWEELVEDYIQQNKEEIAEDLLENGIESLDIIIEIISTLASPAGFIAAMIAAIATYVVFAVTEGAPDDFYGTGTFVFPLGSNALDDVLADLPGTMLPDGSYHMPLWGVPDNWFYGEPCWPSASGFDGIVELGMHWELSELEDFVHSG